MTKDAEGAIETLKEGLAPDRPETFPQADALVCRFAVLLLKKSLILIWVCSLPSSLPGRYLASDDMKNAQRPFWS